MSETLSFIHQEALAKALWVQRSRLAQLTDRIAVLERAVSSPDDLRYCQWIQLMAFVLEFQPDLILEIGRGRGNSTCAFTEAANQLGGKTRVVNVDAENQWSETEQRLRAQLPPDWFKRLSTVVSDAAAQNYKELIRGSERVFVFWDAHSYDTAEIILAKILPEVESIANIVAVHDVFDTDYLPKPYEMAYGDYGVWRGRLGDWKTPLIIGNAYAFVQEAVSILDFTTRNHLSFFSADRSLNQYFQKSPEQLAELRKSLGDKFLAFDEANPLGPMIAGWRWFSLNERRGPFTYPRRLPAQAQQRMGWPGRLRKAGRILLKG